MQTDLNNIKNNNKILHELKGQPYDRNDLRPGRIRAEAILIIIILTISLLIYLFMNLGMRSGSTVEVSLGGEIIAVYPLDKDMEYRIESEDGGYNLLVISGGECYLSDADCPDRLCVKQGHISRSGRSIICLPHKLIITIRGDEADGDGVDSVAR
ncbi:NusG domain II-containing protein [Butyrivibrio sp. MC2013]|uniref:NusG domain II-containing protein n=1 Tax=Butyrivibrio sp. MC2013 TaxID=1280686 RepID=UPI00041D9B5A|nr:NusG domain II-containing protein [Butyrivibrio sp. MC2013]